MLFSSTACKFEVNKILLNASEISLFLKSTVILESLELVLLSGLLSSTITIP